MYSKTCGISPFFKNLQLVFEMISGNTEKSSVKVLIQCNASPLISNSILLYPPKILFPPEKTDPHF